MSTCGVWIGHEPDGTGGAPCPNVAVERLCFLNLCAGGDLDVCAEHLAAELVEHVLVNVRRRR